MVWSKRVVGKDGKINRRLNETIFLVHLRNKFNSGDVWVERYSSYRRIDRYLLPATCAEPNGASWGLPDNSTLCPTRAFFERIESRGIPLGSIL
jgi:hypothetical protein